MYKILIVDDEYYAREGIREMIRRIGNGFVVIGESPDAYHALDFMEREHPDIVLADIHMPVMNGIDFVKCAMERASQAKFIIITGHDEFEYAKQAFKLDVVDFILKPIDQEEVEEALLRAAAYLKRDESAVNRELVGYLRGEALDEQRLRECLPEDRYQLVLIQFGREGETATAEYVKISEYLRKKIAESVNHPCRILQPRSDRIVGLIGGGPAVTAGWLDQIGREMQESGRHYTIVRKEFAVKDLPKGYRIVEHLLKDEFYYGFGHIIEEPFGAVQKVDEGIVKKQADAVKNAVRACDKNGVRQKTRELFCSFARMRLAPHLVLEYVVDLNLFAQAFLEEEQLSMKQMEKRYTIQNLTLKEVEEHLQRLLYRAVVRVSDNKSDTEDSAVKRAIGIINSRYCEDLSLEQLAGEVYLNSSYLSRKLKEQLGCSFIKYITKLRMEKAVELLQVNSSIEQVSKAVGYSNYKHFSDVFKSYTGYLPSAYTKGIRN